MYNTLKMAYVAFAVLFLLSPGLGAQSNQPSPAAPAKTVHAEYFGEGGGGSVQPDPSAADFLESGEAPVRSGDSAGTGDKSAALRSGAGGRGADAGAPGGAAPGPLPAQSPYALWEGLISPLELSPRSVQGMDPAEASRLGRKDYEEHILGVGRDFSRAGAVAASGAAAAAVAPAMFVNVDFKLNAKADLKDAVASFSQATGFAQDARFAPSPLRSGGKVSVWGWMPPSGLESAFKGSPVAKVSLESEPRYVGTAFPLTRVLAGIRVGPEESAAAALDRVTADLARRAGFRWIKTLGYQALPHTIDLALVIEGEVPVSGLDRMLGSPDVLKVSPVPHGSGLRELPGGRESSGRGFVSFVSGRFPALTAATLALGLLTLLPLSGRRRS